MTKNLRRKGFRGKELYELKDRGKGLTQEELVLTVRTYEWAIKTMRRYRASAIKAEERLKKAAVHIAVASDLIFNTVGASDDTYDELEGPGSPLTQERGSLDQELDK